MRGFHWTFATGAACQERTLTPPDTWSCPTFGLACVLMLKPISSELVLFPDFWVSNIPRYYSFAFKIPGNYPTTAAPYSDLGLLLLLWLTLVIIKPVSFHDRLERFNAHFTQCPFADLLLSGLENDLVEYNTVTGNINNHMLETTAV